MILGETKKLAAMIVGGMGPKKEEGAEKNAESFAERAGEPPRDASPGLTAASEEIISALNAKDAQSLARALSNFVVMADKE